MSACQSISDVMRRLGYQPNGGMYRMFTGKIANLGLDTTHFIGRGWARGRKIPNRKAKPLADVLGDSTYLNSARLRRRLITAGLKVPACEERGLRERGGRALPLILDHINGVHTDNRLENLRILWPKLPCTDRHLVRQ